MIKNYISRLFLGAILSFLTVSNVSCGGGESDGETADTAVYTAVSDTLSELLGRAKGYELLYEIDTYRTTVDPTYNVGEVAKGLEVTLDRRHPLAYVKGAQMGLDIDQDVTPLEKAGINVDRKGLMETIVNNVDTLRGGNPQQQALSERYIALITRANNMGAANVPSSLADSLQSIYGSIVGSLISSEIHNFNKNEGKEFDLASFLAGLERVVSEKRSPEFMYGVFQGANIAEQIAVFEQKGTNVRRERVLEEMQAVLEEGKVDAQTVETSKSLLDGYVEGIEKRKYEEEDQQMSRSDKAIQNIKTGEALVAQMKKTTPGAKTADSGLTYVITVPGEGAGVAESDTLILNYTGSHLDGKVFDSNLNARMSADRTIEGLREGLKMLGKGGKATFWIPGGLAYRGHGLPDVGIGPMETLVFEVEVVDILPGQSDSRRNVMR